MRTLAPIAALAVLSLATGGCAIAAMPVAAGAMIAKDHVDGRKAKRRKEQRRAAPVASVPTLPASGALAGQVYAGSLPAPDGSPARVGAAPVGAGAVPPGMQFLYGSGEAAALDYQAYMGLIDTIISRSGAAYLGHDEPSVVLRADATLEKPAFVPCGAKPLAVVFDVDETALLNLGYEADDSRRGGAYDEARWERWERTGANAVAAVPGMIEAKRVAAASKVTFVFNTTRSAANAAATEAALTGAGLGPVKHGETLWLKGDEGGGSGKDARRQAIARRYCVIAMVGDQLGDFSDLFNAPGLSPSARRALVSLSGIKMKWGHGWFVLPNPVYGTALKGGIDDVFPSDKRWADPGPAAPVTAGVK